jgi:hypothetical protein
VEFRSRAAEVVTAFECAGKMAMKRSTRSKVSVKSPKDLRPSEVTAVRRVLGDAFDADKFLEALEATVPVAVIDSRKDNATKRPRNSRTL